MTHAIRPVCHEERSSATLMAAAEAEGGAFLFRLCDQWLDSTLRFEGDGELLLGALARDQLLGIGSLSRDPYSPEPAHGRVRLRSCS